MFDTVLQLWEFADAPQHLQRLIPLTYAGGWLAFLLPGGPRDVVDCLVARWNSSGFSVVCCEAEDGGLVLAGPHLPRLVDHSVEFKSSSGSGST
jgi:hypothetical protein